MVRAGEGGRLVDEFIRKGVVSIGWFNDEPFAKNLTNSGLKEKLSLEEGWSAGKVNITAGQIWRFLNEFNIGDHVVTYDPDFRVYFFGDIASEYIYDKNTTYHHVRKVEWHEAPVSRDALTISTKNSLGAISTIFEITREAWDDIYTNNASYISDEELRKMEEISDSFQEQIIDDAVYRSSELIKDRISNLSWEETEDLVDGLLKGMGYKTRRTSKGPDLGSDILASPDGLGMQEPRIKVEVKKRTKDKIGAPDIRSFSGGLRGSEKGLYVCTTGFSKDAQMEAERANFNITLIDLEWLVKLIIDNYENFDATTKALIPLTRIYWPLKD